MPKAPATPVQAHSPVASRHPPNLEKDFLSDTGSSPSKLEGVAAGQGRVSTSDDGTHSGGHTPQSLRASSPNLGEQLAATPTAPPKKTAGQGCFFKLAVARDCALFAS